MLTSVEYTCFKVLRKATLPLGPFTLLIGPNGSGKSTALDGIAHLSSLKQSIFEQVVSLPPKSGVPCAEARLTSRWRLQSGTPTILATWRPGTGATHSCPDYGVGSSQWEESVRLAQGIRRYSFDPARIAQACPVRPSPELDEAGHGLPAVLDFMRDHAEQNFEALQAELPFWTPEFSRVVLTSVTQGHKAVSLRRSHGGGEIPAHQLSQGTLVALALLTLSYLPSPPTIICLEEPDRGLHPRLLRNVRDAMYRLTCPDSSAGARPPVQVIATTHSPFFLDLFRDKHEEVVIAEKVADGAEFNRLVDLPHIIEIIGDTNLGEAWYTGVLGGVPADT